MFFNEEKWMVEHTMIRTVSNQSRKFLTALVFAGCLLLGAGPVYAMPITPFTVDYEFTTNDITGFSFHFIAGAFQETRLVGGGDYTGTLTVDENGVGSFEYSGNFDAQLLDAATGNVLDTGRVSLSGEFSNVVFLDTATGNLDPNRAPDPLAFGTTDSGVQTFTTDIDFLVVNGFTETFFMFKPANLDHPQLGVLNGVSLALTNGNLLGWGTTGFGMGDLHGTLVSANTTEVPEPMSALLFGMALMGARGISKKN